MFAPAQLRGASDHLEDVVLVVLALAVPLLLPRRPRFLPLDSSPSGAPPRLRPLPLSESPMITLPAATAPAAPTPVVAVSTVVALATAALAVATALTPDIVAASAATEVAPGAGLRLRREPLRLPPEPGVRSAPGSRAVALSCLIFGFSSAALA